MRPQKAIRGSLLLRNGSLRVVVVSDTHARPHPRALELIAAQKPHAILHAGDVGSLEVVDALSAVAPSFAVRGNIDTPSSELPDWRTLELVEGKQCVLTLLLVHCALNGPTLRGEAVRLARREHAGLVVCGHSHLPFLGQDQGLFVFNPGSLGPRRFRLPIAFGVIELAQGGIGMKHIDCETGQPWHP